MSGGRHRRGHRGGDETEEEQRRKNKKCTGASCPVNPNVPLGPSVQVANFGERRTMPTPEEAERAFRAYTQQMQNRKPGSSRRRSRRMRGGMGYGFGGTIGTAGPQWNSSWGGEITKSGTPIYDTADRPPVTGGRRRKSRKGSKKAKKSRRRTMRGGMSVAHASAGFAGTGSRGLADYKDVGGSQPFSNDVVPLK